jgi:hypothetical protein
MGLNGSNYSNASFTVAGAKEGYVYTASEALAVGTGTAGKPLYLFTGGTLVANRRVTITDTDATFTGIIKGTLEKVWVDSYCNSTQAAATATHTVLNFSTTTTDTHSGVSGNGANTITAGAFVVGQYYIITSAGNTNFTLIGAANSNVGTAFKATGVGTGTGQAMEQWQYTIKQAGVYDVRPQITWNSVAMTVGVGFEMQVLVNGTAYNIAYLTIQGNHTAYYRMTGYKLLELVVGDIVQVTGRQTAASTLNVYTGATWSYINILKVR